MAFLWSSICPFSCFSAGHKMKTALFFLSAELVWGKKGEEWKLQPPNSYLLLVCMWGFDFNTKAQQGKWVKALNKICPGAQLPYKDLAILLLENRQVCGSSFFFCLLTVTSYVYYASQTFIHIHNVSTGDGRWDYYMELQESICLLGVKWSTYSRCVRKNMSRRYQTEKFAVCCSAAKTEMWAVLAFPRLINQRVQDQVRSGTLGWT